MIEIPEINNRRLEKVTGFNTHRQIKRWAVAFLEPDPEIGQHSGRPRTYSFDQAVRISVGGTLVSGFGFSIDDARRTLDDIFQWLQEKCWLPSSHVIFRPVLKHPGWFNPDFRGFPNLEIEIARRKAEPHGYFVREILKRIPVNKSRTILVDKYRVHVFGSQETLQTVEGRQTLDFSTKVQRLSYGLSRPD